MGVSRLRIACVQINAGEDWKKNWKQSEKFLIQSARQGSCIAALPENFMLRASEKESDRLAPQIFLETLTNLKKTAVENRLTIVAGSLLEPLNPGRSKGRPRFSNTCFVISSKGEIILRYRKMHLFDINLPGVRVQESKTITAGNKPGLFTQGHVKAGVGICYDLRFPEYFRSLSQKGAEVLFVPANFTAKTGKTAWEVLLRARAIENQCFVVAPGQCGRHPGSGIISYGHSMVVNPLGEVLSEASQATPQMLIQDLDFVDLRRFRRLFPVLKHRNPSL